MKTDHLVQKLKLGDTGAHARKNMLIRYDFFLLRNNSGQTIHAAFGLYNIDNKEYILTISLSSLVCFLVYFSPSVHYLFLLIVGHNSVHPGKEFPITDFRK